VFTQALSVYSLVMQVLCWKDFIFWRLSNPWSAFSCVYYYTTLVTAKFCAIDIIRCASKIAIFVLCSASSIIRSSWSNIFRNLSG